MLCGDIAENFRSETNVNIFKKYFLEQFKDTLCVVENHDRYSADFNENDEYIKSIWPHDTMYYSKIVKDKVILVGVDNSYETFYPEQCEALGKEIENAREKGQIIIFVCHIPLNMLDCSSGVNKQMYDLLLSNTDVVKLALAGHAHGDSKTMVGNLPVYTLEGTGHDRMNKNVLIITIK